MKADGRISSANSDGFFPAFCTVCIPVKEIFHLNFVTVESVYDAYMFHFKK
jgi:hypothetical protein